MQGGNALKYVHERVMGLLTQLKPYEAQICGTYVSQVIFNMHNFNYSPVEIPRVDFCFPTEDDILDLVRDLPGQLLPIKDSCDFFLRDGYGDNVCRVRFIVKAKLMSLFRHSHLYYDHCNKITTDSQFNLSDVIEDVRQRRAVFTDKRKGNRWIQELLLVQNEMKDWSFHLAKADGQLQRVVCCATANGCVIREYKA